MRKPVQISITPSESGIGKLIIQEAMEQVWDFFDLLSDENSQHVQWVLEDVSLNSPLVIVAKPIDIQTNRLAYDVVAPIVEDVARLIENISSSQPCKVNLSDKKRKKFTQLLERNINGIEKTRYNFGYGVEPVTIDQNLAERGLKKLTQPSEMDNLLATFAVQAYGSITGTLIRLGKYHNKPAICIEEFNTGNSIWCQIDHDTLADIEDKIRAKDVWEHRDIRAQGMLDYNDSGKLTHITAGKVSYLNRKEISLDKLHDPDFSEGLPSEEYLERLRED